MPLKIAKEFENRCLKCFIILGENVTGINVFAKNITSHTLEMKCLHEDKLSLFNRVYHLSL